MVRLGIHLLLLVIPIAMPVFATESRRDSIACEIQAALTLQVEEQAADSRSSAPDAALNSHGLRDFYERRGFAPVWAQADRRGQLVSALEGLIDDGLDPEDYDLSGLRRSFQEPAQSLAGLAATDLRASRSYLHALEDLARGRVDPAEVEPTWRQPDMEPVNETREYVLSLASENLDDIEIAFTLARPPAPLYQILRKAHREWRAAVDTVNWTPIPPGPLLKEGMTDPRVPLLRQRLQDVLGEAPVPGTLATLYDAELVAAVRGFQMQHQLNVDGIVGPDTLGALNLSAAQRLDQLRANLERLRWFGWRAKPLYVLVDIGGAEVQVMRDGQMIWSARVQVGRPSRPSPSLVSQLTHLTINPTWTVPPTILRNDKLPEIRRDIGYLARNRIRVLDYSGQQLSPETVDWDRPTGIMLRQDAGPQNALGKVAFRFPNPFMVYLHDTPSQRLFEVEQRTFSSGCVRVERALELVDVLLAEEPEARRELAESLLRGTRTRDFHLTRPVPIVIAYWTVGVAEDGSVVFRPDVYHRDAALALALQQQVR